MRLSELPIPDTFSELVKTFNNYYDSFYLEMIRMSNSNLTIHVEQYIEEIKVLAKYLGTPNSIRAAIGIVCLDEFGYHNFVELSKIFDRLMPQIDEEYGKFTCWCVGKLIHHPSIEKARYVSHLFTRVIGWARAKGRRMRPLNAAQTLESLSLNAGSIVVMFFQSLQNVIWHLISHPSLKILEATAKAISAYGRAIIRYGRTDLKNFMDFFTSLCNNLLYYDDPIRKAAALSLLTVLVNENPNYFVSSFSTLYELVNDNTENMPYIVQLKSFILLCELSRIDATQFMDTVSNGHLMDIGDLLLEYPREVAKSLSLLCTTVKPFMKNNINKIFEYAQELIDEEESDSAFIILTAIAKEFENSISILDTTKLIDLVQKKITLEYNDFFISLANSPAGLPNQVSEVLCQRLFNELRDSKNLNAIKLISKLPKETLHHQENFIEQLLWPLARDKDVDIRNAVPKAVFNLGRSSDTISLDSISKKFLQQVIFEESVSVRCHIIKAISNNVIDSLASPEMMKFYEIFINDESISVREIVYKLIAKLSTINPMATTSLARKGMLDCFFIIRRVPSIRTKSRFLRIIPEIIKASQSTIKAYSGGILEIIMDILTKYDTKRKYDNFIEEDSQISIIISICNILSLLAPLVPNQVSKYADTFIPILCGIALFIEHRLPSLAIFNLFYVLLSPGSATITYRTLLPVILSTCSTYLSTTRSRKARMSILKVMGAIGVPEIHQKPPPKGTQTPENMDDNLAREFFHPSRDANSTADESWLVNQNSATCDQYFSSYTAMCLINHLKDDNLKPFYKDIISGLVEVLRFPKMYLLSYFDAFVSRLLYILETSTVDELKELLPLYTQLINNSTHNTSPFLARSLALIQNRFCDELLHQILDLIVAFLKSIRDGFSPYASETICLLVDVLDNKKTKDSKGCEIVLKAYSLIGLYASDLLYLIIPQICDAIVCEQTLFDVKIKSLETLIEIVQNIDTFSYLGTISRTLEYSLSSKNEHIVDVSFKLLYIILKAHGLSFLTNAQPLFEFLKKSKLETVELRNLIFDVSKGVYSDSFKPLNTDSKPPPQQVQEKIKFVEDSILSRVNSDNITVGRHVEQWIRSFNFVVIQYSPNSAIRASSTFANVYFPFAQKMFHSAFFSCWREMSSDGQKQLTSFFIEFLKASEAYQTVARAIIDLIAFMDKIESPIPIPPEDLVSACVRFGSVSYALKLQQHLFELNPNDEVIIGQLIDIFVKLGDYSNAIGVWKKSKMKLISLNNADVLSRLKMWDKAEPIYKEQYKQQNDYKSLKNLIQCQSSLAMWPQILENIDKFYNLLPNQKRDLSRCFAEAALHMGQWETLDNILKYRPDNSLRCTVLSAFSALHNKNYKEVDKIIADGFSLIASRPILLTFDNQCLHTDTMLQCQELVEVGEMKDWLTKNNRKEIELVWKQRLKTAPRNFDLWFTIFANRVKVAQLSDDTLIHFFQLRSATLGTKLHYSAFDILFPNFKYETAPDPQKLHYLIAQWNIGANRDEALQNMLKLTKTLNGNLRDQAHYFYGSWLYQINGNNYEALLESYKHLDCVVSNIDDSLIRIPTDHLKNEPIESFEVSITLPSQIYNGLIMHTTKIETLRKWSDVNIALTLIDKQNQPKYVINAIKALSRCASLSPSFPDVVQLLNLFFEFAEIEPIFETCNEDISNLSTKLLLQASPQIFIQICHPYEKVRNFVEELVFNLLFNHFHDIVFSLIVLKYSRNVERARGTRKILDRLKSVRPEICQEVFLIRRSLLDAAVTWGEKVLQRISDASDHFQRSNYDKMKITLSSIIELTKHPRCEMHENFIQRYSKHLSQLEQILKNYKPNNSNSIGQLSQWCKQMNDAVEDDVKRIRTIQLSTISPELCEKNNFVLAVPGTYKPNKPVIHISYFVRQFTVYLSKQQPKDIIIKGEDGNFYQYLLKGHEDLRLDERIMQFFRCINSLLMKETSFNSNLIETISVIPLSMSHGLVQWATGTDTLRAVVEQYRKLHKREPMEEYVIIDKLGCYNFDFLLPIQKMDIIEKIFDQIPDTDIANFIWLKANNAEKWLKQTTTFTISTAMTSIIGYIIGLGDRHPSNLLLNKITGKVVHIDFGDCFEKASKRKYLPEVVPFRLTRMMVKALGAGGVDGLFKTTFINTSTILRNNNKVLEMILSIFVHEPLIDPDSTQDESVVEIDDISPMFDQSLRNSSTLSRAPTGSVLDVGRAYMKDQNVFSNEETRTRIHQKLVGTDINPNTTYSVEQQADWLIQQATSTYNFARMYSGWCPFW